jgi:Domain of unknown function (DUF4293)
MFTELIALLLILFYDSTNSNHLAAAGSNSIITEFKVFILQRHAVEQCFYRAKRFIKIYYTHSLIVIVVYYLETQKFTEGNYALTAVLTFLIPVFFIVAWMGIRKDEKLIKSMDRLR